VVGLAWTGLDWAGLAWTRLDWSGDLQFGHKKSFRKLNKVKFQGFLRGFGVSRLFTEPRRGHSATKKLLGFSRIYSDSVGCM
jgi:hypothetical protein